MNLIFDEFADKRKEELRQIHALFVEVIGRLEEIYDVRPFNQQTAQSLTELFALVQAAKPTTIFELGAGSRSSSVALSLAAARLSPVPRIVSLDLAPVDFAVLTRQHFGDLALAPVTDIAMEATAFHIPSDWGDRVFMLYDAHDDDIPGVKIFPHARDVWFPTLAGAVVAVHDCSVYSGPQTGLADYYYQAVYSPDVTLIGFGEVPELVSFLRDRGLPLGLPGREMAELGIGAEGTSLVYFQLPRS